MGIAASIRKINVRKAKPKAKKPAGLKEVVKKLIGGKEEAKEEVKKAKSDPKEAKKE